MKRAAKSYWRTRIRSFFRSGCKVASALLNAYLTKSRVTNSSNKATVQNRAIVNQCPRLLVPILLRTKCFSATSHIARLDLRSRRQTDKSRPQKSAWHKFRSLFVCATEMRQYRDTVMKRGSMVVFLHSLLSSFNFSAVSINFSYSLEHGTWGAMSF